MHICSIHFANFLKKKMTFFKKSILYDMDFFGAGLQNIQQGRSEGVLGCPCPPLCKPFLRKQPIIFHGENAMTIMFDTV